MSTRCQVKVSDYDERENVSNAVTLYHHSDGYPTAMLQVMADACDILPPASGVGFHNREGCLKRNG